MTITMSANHEIVIPKEVTQEMGFTEGQEFWIFRDRNIVKLVAVQPIEELRGIAKNVDISHYREEED